MNANDVLKMIDAGFTADEIRKMTASPADSVSHVLSPEPKEEAKAASSPAAPVEEVKEDPAAEAKPEAKPEDVMESIKKTISDQIAANMKSYEDNMAKVMKMAGMPSLDDVKPKGIEDIISNFFKEE